MPYNVKKYMKNKKTGGQIYRKNQMVFLKECKFYDSIDISSVIKDGRNIITVFSHKIENGGIYAKVYSENNVFCETDESWKIKKYEACFDM